jgi:hypothetical protein
MTRSRLAQWIGLGLACGVLTACSPPFGRLEGILVETRPAQPDEFGRLHVIREGETREGTPGMRVQKGDTIMTAADGVAVVTLQAGWEVIFEPGTVAKIENPSIFVKIGKLIIKKLKEVKEALTVNNEFVSAGAEGTEFVFEVTPDSAVQLAVLEGRVVVHSRLARWDSTTYEAGEGGMISAGSPPGPRRRLDPATVRDIRQHIREVERVVRPAMPNVIGLAEAVARDAIATAGLRVGSTRKTITRSARPGVVVATIPPGGTRVRAGDRVTLQVEDSSLVVPQVVGLSLGQAVEVLRRAGFSPPDTATTFSRNARIGTVVAAAPRVGEVISATTRIRLTVATNIPIRGVTVDSARMTVRSCTVPNLIERTEAVARSMLKRANLQAGKVHQFRYGGTLVTRQNPTAGSSVSCGSRVDFDTGTTDIGE